MPPIRLLQCNSWQPQPKFFGSFRGPSPGNVKSPPTIFMKGQTTTVTTEPVSSPTVTNEPQSTPGSLKPANIANVTSNVQGPGLGGLIISRIQTGSDGPELEVFSNVSEEDYAYVLDAINSDCKVVRKPSYNPHLQELIVTLPSAIHEAVLVPLRTVMGTIVNSLTIPDEFNVSLPIHMTCMVDVPATADLPPKESYWLGIPDLVLMFRICDADILPYWPFEVSVSETSKSAIGRLQTYGDRNENVLAATHISIIESQSHIPPTYEWGMEKELHQRGVQIKDLTCSKNGGIASLSHMWFHLTTVTITMWVHPPNKCLNLKSRYLAYYATAIHHPF
ncbi:hypothetical protein BDR07DRAFT_1478536 [Suillus spraguei]|nr:hypothetical protein BDR07DRAFT_1478536 [Suillus spraguei]